MIYFIKDGDFIKIGMSADPWRRLASFQTSHHNELELMAVMPGGPDLEAGLHRAFSKWAKRGEWFEQNPQLLAFIEMARATFPDSQRSIAEDVADIVRLVEYHLEPGEKPVNNKVLLTGSERHGVFRNSQSPKPLAMGESFSFRMTHKGHFQTPSTDPFSSWDTLRSLMCSGYWRKAELDEWYVMYAPGIRFEFADMQHVLITRVGEVMPELPSRYGILPRVALEMGLNDVLKEAVYNRKNNAGWLGVYNDERQGVTIAIRKVPGDEPVKLDVPDEIISYWRNIPSKRALAQGVSIEA